MLMRRANREISAEARLAASREVFASIKGSTYFVTADCVALYSDLPDELPTADTIAHYISLGKRVVLPRVTGDTTMEFFEITDTTLSTGSFGISEPQGDNPIDPSEIDLMVVPAVALCHDGRRLGRGRGYYDRYLARQGFRAHTIGVGYAHQLLQAIPCFEYDITMDEVITPLLNRGKFSISSLILSTLEAAGVDANRIGCGVSYLNARGLSWVLLKYSITTYRTPPPTEKVKIETWVRESTRIASIRNFRFVGRDGETFAEATSQWCMIDLKSRRVAEISTSGVNYADFAQQREVNIELPRRLPTIDPSDPDTITHTHLTTEGDIDFNGHVNTIRYIEMLFETLPPDDMYRLDNRHLDLQFVSEAHLGETLTIRRKEGIFEIHHPDGTICVRAIIK